MHARPRIRVTTAPPAQTRQHRTRIVVGLGGLLLVGLVAFIWWKARQPAVERQRGPRERPVQEYVVTEKPTPLRQDLRMEQDYRKMPLETSPPAVPAAPTPRQAAAPPTGPPPGRQGPPTRPPQPAGVPPPPPAPPVIVQAPAPPPGRWTAPPGQRTSQPTGVSPRWFGTKTAIQGNLLAAPVPRDKDETAASKLFPKAVWEKPKDPKKVLYADQIINGLLMGDINSETPGTVRIKVTQDVTDRWGLGTVLVPVDTTILAAMETQVRYGQKRIPAAVPLAILPDGTAIQFTKGQAGDQMGAAGIPAHVNNHYGALLLATGLQALLNIGTRSIAGSTTGFNPTVEQQIADEIARSVNRTGNQIVQRELTRAPTLTQDYGTPVTVQFAENINLQSAPTVVAK